VICRQRERGGGVLELAARVLGVLGRELARHDAPHLVLGVRVLDPRDRLARLPGDGAGGDVVATRAVDGITRAGVVAGELDGDRPVLVLGDR
jgi:hypothetical protein